MRGTLTSFEFLEEFFLVFVLVYVFHTSSLEKKLAS